MRRRRGGAAAGGGGLPAEHAAHGHQQRGAAHELLQQRRRVELAVHRAPRAAQQLEPARALARPLVRDGRVQQAAAPPAWSDADAEQKCQLGRPRAFLLMQSHEACGGPRPSDAVSSERLRWWPHTASNLSPCFPTAPARWRRRRRGRRRRRRGGVSRAPARQPPRAASSPHTTMAAPRPQQQPPPMPVLPLPLRLLLLLLQGRMSTPWLARRGVTASWSWRRSGAAAWVSWWRPWWVLRVA